ncbi:hypothetical protein [Stenoxybacter acetivorans]|nr:hypothetical protein [Stenoxybacter acetivorans]
MLGFPKADVVRAFFIDITLMRCWDAEDEDDFDLSGVLYAESLL